MEVPTIDAISVNMASVVTAVPLLEVAAIRSEDGAATKPAREKDEEPLPLTLPGVSSVGRVSASRASGDVDEAVATVQARGTPVAISTRKRRARSRGCSAPRQKPAVSTFGVVLGATEGGRRHQAQTKARRSDAAEIRRRGGERACGAILPCVVA